MDKSNNKHYYWTYDRVIMSIAIVVLIIIIFILLFIKQKDNNIADNITFEKKKMCVEMRNSYEKYIKDLWTIESIEQSVGEVEMFYNLERDTCLGAFWVSSNLAGYRTTYVISDYMNGNEEIFGCTGNGRSILECEEKWKQKKIELGK